MSDMLLYKLTAIINSLYFLISPKRQFVHFCRIIAMYYYRKGLFFVSLTLVSVLLFATWARSVDLTFL
ncbi:hypothetical protein BDF20DRAFT_285647 [Mycotypha africana]|uniref:uncharacterized protein n=1 Tax=Mycotypha africana TaxID=64632 RepID=UPI0023003674|nr:uncharacterized protein BDF20DRAFT_285647 [Mycotypha africana]KAI8987717.1 hypothetical protein BDF20DRAFT_285647 [Mycotypha africana]